MITWSGHLSMLFADVPERDRPRAAAAAGFDTVESWWPEDEASRREWPAEIERLGLSVALLNFPAGDIRAGERGRLNLPGDDGAIQAELDRAIALAAALGAPHMNLLTGIEVDRLPRDDQLDLAASRVGEAARRAADHGTRVLLEPLNPIDTPGYLICDVPTALDVAARSGEPVGILYDVFHAARAGRDPLAEIAAYGDRIAHVHYADHPGRGVPGSGSLELGAVVDALLAVGYDGPLGLELSPGDTDPAELPALLPRRRGVSSPIAPPAAR